MFKNVSGQKATFLAIDTTTNFPITGDAANLTAYVSQDDGSVTVLGDTSATELDAANAPGLYSFDLGQAETNADKLLFSGKSATSGVALIPLLIYTDPAGFTALTDAAIAAAVRDVDNGTPAAGSFGEAARNADAKAADIQITLGSPAASVSADIAAVKADTAAVKLKTDNLPSDPADESLVIAATDAIMSRLGAPAGASVSVDVAAVKVDTAAVKAKTDQFVFTVANRVDATASDKTGFKLASDGLDSIAITAPSGVAGTFPGLLVQLWRRFFKKVAKDSSGGTIKTYADDNSTAVTTQTITTVGSVDTVGPAS